MTETTRVALASNRVVDTLKSRHANTFLVAVDGSEVSHQVRLGSSIRIVGASPPKR
jgi:hypothetical protein